MQIGCFALIGLKSASECFPGDSFYQTAFNLGVRMHLVGRYAVKKNQVDPDQGVIIHVDPYLTDLALKVPIIFEDAEVVNKSYPDFWADFRGLGFKTEQL